MHITLWVNNATILTGTHSRKNLIKAIHISPKINKRNINKKVENRRKKKGYNCTSANHSESANIISLFTKKVIANPILHFLILCFLSYAIIIQRLSAKSIGFLEKNRKIIVCQMRRKIELS
jgi:hypothetical protein